MAYPNTFADMQTEVINRLRLNATDDLQKTKDALNRAYADVCVSLEANETSATMTLTSGTNSYTLPSGVIRIEFMVAAPASSTSAYGAPLGEVSLEQILELRRATNVTATGDTYVYCLVGQDIIEFYPTPGAADRILIYYAAQPTALSAASDVPVIPEPWGSRLCVYGACADLSDFVKDGNSLTYQGMFEQEKQKFVRHLNRRRGRQIRQLPVANARVYVPHDPSTDIR